MAKPVKETPNTPEVKVKIEPVVKVSAPVKYFPVKPGHYHLVKVDKNGDEILGSDVQVSEYTYNRSFSKLPNYKVKKNPQK